MSFRWGFKAEANRISLRVREKLGLAPIDPIDPTAVCAFFEVELLELNKLGINCSLFLDQNISDFSAVTVPCGGRIAIVHNETHHPYRQRSNICHELAHIFLKHESVPPLTEAGELIRDGGIEAEANFLSGALLMPNEAAIHVVGNGLLSTAQRLYGISKPMLDFRLKVSGAHTIHHRRRLRVEGPMH